MKNCLCCGAECAPDAPHCLACGECSFGPVAAPVPVREAPPNVPETARAIDPPNPDAEPTANDALPPTEPAKRGPGRPRKDAPN